MVVINKWGAGSATSLMPNAEARVQSAMREARDWEVVNQYQGGGSLIPPGLPGSAQFMGLSGTYARGLRAGESAVPSWAIWAAGGVAAGALVGYLLLKRKRS